MNNRVIINDIYFYLISLIKERNIFIYRDQIYKYHIHKRSWATERIVEIPIVLNYIKLYKNKRILEVGDVLFQFTEANWDIVDKYPLRKGIIGEDIITYNPTEKYDLIVSISTLEHIGFNEDVSEGEKPEDYIDKNKTIDAINNIKYNCLNRRGTIIITVPLGYNKEMDKKLLNDELGLTELYFMKRISKNNEWREVKRRDIINPEYGRPFPCANYICIGIYNDNTENN